MSEIIVSKYCQACGNGLIATAAICPKCGTMVAGSVSPAVKSKTVAVVLAVLFGFWAWLYTYSVNAAKFWIVLGIQVLLQVIYFATFAATYTSGSGTGTFVFVALAGVGLWLWALIDNSAKPAAFYENYGRQQ